MTGILPRIAVVDDEKPVRTMLRRALRLADCEVDEFASGEEFLHSLAGHVPDVVVLDVHLSGISGFDVEARLRAAQLRVPLIFITASDDAALDRSASAAGAVCLLRKPFGMESLLAAIRRALET